MSSDLTIYVGDAGEKYSDPDDWRELIVNGRLQPDSVIPYRRNGALAHARARDIPELAEVVGALKAAEAAAVAPAASGSSPLTEPPPLTLDKPLAQPSPTVLTAPVADAPESGPAPFQPQHRQSPRPPAQEGVWPMRVLAAFAGLVVLAVIFGALRSTGGGEGDIVVDEAAPVSMFATRETRVRVEPRSSGPAPLASLSRGDAVSGTWVDGAGGGRWLQLTEGPHQGAYVWGANLLGERPPALAEMIRSTAEVVTAGHVLSAPRPDANILNEVSPGQRLEVVGRTETGWLEITRKSGGVGYVSDTVFTSPEAIAEDAPPDSMFGGLPMHAPYDEEQAVPVEPGAQPSFDCAQAQSPAERQVCADPELASLDRALAQAYARAVAASTEDSAMRREQRLWLSLRDETQHDRPALVELYTRRLRELESGT
jgi:hypothetical protein